MNDEPSNTTAGEEISLPQFLQMLRAIHDNTPISSDLGVVNMTNALAMQIKIHGDEAVGCEHMIAKLPIPKTDPTQN